MNRFWLLLILAAMLAVACGPAGTPTAPSSDDNSEPKHGGTLSVRATLDPFNFDIHLSRTIPNIWAARQPTAAC